MFTILLEKNFSCLPTFHLKSYNCTLPYVHCSVVGMNSHQLAAAKESKNEKLREAFGIKEDFAAGSSFTGLHRI